MQGCENHKAILDSWARLSSAEAEAIEDGNWAHLDTLHRAKEALRQRLEREAGAPDASDPEWRSQLAEVLERERQNLSLLARRRAAAEQERASVEQARWNLRRQQGSFGHRSATSWQQYS